MKEPGGEHCAGVPGRYDRVRLPVANRADRGNEARVGLRADRLGGLVGHVDRLGRLDEGQAMCIEVRRPVEDDVGA